VSNAPSYAAVVTPHLGENHLNLLNMRVHLDVHPFLLGMSIASLCSPLGLNSAWRRSLKTTLVLLWINPSWLNLFRQKTATFEILISDKLPPELSLLAARRGVQLAKSETWAWRYHFSIGKLDVYAPTEYSYVNALPPLSEIFYNVYV